MDDWLEELFTNDQTVIAANMAEAARIAAVEKADKEEDAARIAYRKAHSCPKCAGTGRIAQFSHIKAGECFLCGGSGVFHG